MSPARGVALGGDARGHAPGGSAAARGGHPGSSRPCPGMGRWDGCCAAGPSPIGIHRVPAGAAKPARETQPCPLPVPCPIPCVFPAGSRPCHCELPVPLNLPAGCLHASAVASSLAVRPIFGSNNCLLLSPLLEPCCLRRGGVIFLGSRASPEPMGCPVKGLVPPLPAGHGVNPPKC